MSEISWTIEQTNEQRLKLGLPPLKLEKTEDKKQVEKDNYIKEQSEKERIDNNRLVQERLKKVKNERELLKSQSGKGLGEKQGDDSLLSFLKKNKKRFQKVALNMKEDFDEEDKRSQEAAKLLNNKAKKARGSEIQVAHNYEDFEEGEEAILTLKDANVLDEDDDELVNANLLEKEKLKKDLENKKKKTNYNPYDDDEFAHGTINGQPRNILSHYDEEIGVSEPKKKGFKINSLNDFASNKETFKNNINDLTGAISLELNQLNKVDDYYTTEEAAQFKKPKSKGKSRKKKREEERELFDNIIISINDPDTITMPSDSNFVDDNELQLCLQKARTTALKRNKNLDGESAAKEVLKDKKEEKKEEIESNEEGIIVSQTSEFVQNLATSAAILSEKMQSIKEKNEKNKKQVKEDNSKASETIDNKVKKEVKEEDLNKLREEEGVDALFEDNVKAGRGLAGALAYFTKKGTYKPPTEEAIKRDELLTRQNKMIEVIKNKEKEKEKEKGKRSNKENYDLKPRTFVEDSIARLANYKPDINLEYRDTHGNILNQKEAFKELSHKFHGKSSGLKKTEKMLQRKEAQKRLDNMDSMGAPFETSKSTSKRHKK
ncbi:hypothetical protein K502DRAFT_361737 [Neoconidiobolus thromboides FSU 785]|nr:hypothetical protein K502DRAFT_361737 [Neoconidiobolus thromboides FSU 785]